MKTSSLIRSLEIKVILYASSFIALNVCSSILKPSLDAKRIALNILRASSLKRSLAHPIALIVLFFKSSNPLWRSIIDPSVVEAAKALIVKSLLDKSSSILSTKETENNGEEQ